MRRRDFLLTAISTAWLGCRPSGVDANDEEIGPLLAPAALAARIDDAKSGKVAVLYVGPEALFKRGRVPGARNIGEAGTEAGRKALQSTFAQLPQETEVVVYCGCCPTRSCPNVRPASAMIRASRRANARVLDLPTRFGTDWADKGFPVEQG
jgi:hypothetical protein